MSASSATVSLVYVEELWLLRKQNRFAGCSRRLENQEPYSRIQDLEAGTFSKAFRHGNRFAGTSKGLPLAFLNKVAARDTRKEEPLYQASGCKMRITIQTYTFVYFLIDI